MSAPATSSSRLRRLITSSLAVCLPLLGLAIYQTSTTLHAEHTLARARGVVISDDLERYSDGDGMVTGYRPVVEYRPANGEVVRITEDGTASREFQSGASVEMIYDPANPRGAHIHSFWRTWQDVIILFGSGLVFTIGCAIAVAFEVSRRRRADATRQ